MGQDEGTRQCIMEERIPKTIPTPQNIKKAIVFFDHCGSLSNCVNIIQGWLTELGYLFKEAAMVVCRYYSNLAELDKEQIYNEFKKLDAKIWILCATDAISVGCNIPDILTVV